MSSVTITVQAGDITEGLWCEDCNLPTGVSVVLLLSSDPPSPHYPATTVKRLCGECGGDRIGDGS